LIASDGGENPYRIHQELGQTMTKNVTVVRYNKDIEETLGKLDELDERYRNVSLADTTNWTNQNLSFTRALGDMLVLARVIAHGALRRDECRGAHYKPDFDLPSPTAEGGAALREQANHWCDAFDAQNRRWLKTTIAQHSPDGPKFSDEEVDVTLIPPRPRTYGLKGAEIIEEVWRARQRGPAHGGARREAVGAAGGTT
jgi:succinate dehydrogenase / fumarate reductase flavoprotein subunit